jgi:hypothetical protein
MSAKDVIRELAGSLVELLDGDGTGLADDLRERVTTQLLSGAGVQELADSIVSGVELLVKMAQPSTV